VDRRRLKIAFPQIWDHHWTGGINYITNLAFALKRLAPERRPQLALIPKQESFTDSKDLGFDELLAAPTPRGRAHRAVDKLAKKLRLRSPWPNPYDSVLRASSVDVLFASDVSGLPTGYPILGWLPDFQHVRLPEMFTRNELLFRDQLFQHVAERATCVILSSEDAANDFRAFAPRSARKARTLPFVAPVPDEVFGKDPSWVCEKYYLPRKFLFLPNQFWKHKNHSVVLNALGILKNAGIALTVVCTGTTYDYRHPGYFASLLAEVSSAGLRESLILLGFVSRTDYFALMRQSVAVIQPSLFEGWSTTIEEAKSFGKPIIASALSVHREQVPEGKSFDPNDPNRLAELMTAAHEGSAGPDLAMEEVARNQWQSRLLDFAARFLTIAEEAVSMKN
jgi:glycosyltransferase involved in cell wall biosynthesis